MESEAKKENTNNKNNEEKKSKKDSLREILTFAVIAFIIVLPIRMFIAQPFVVSGSSMVPTFQNNDYLIVDEISYRFSPPKRNDVIVFKYPNDTRKFFIKRVIGLPNETVEINKNIITIYNLEHSEGFTLNEPFIKYESSDYMHKTLKGDEYFVMGDNRNASSDSRFWGPLEKKFITGRVLLRLLPFKNMNVLPGQGDNIIK